MPTNRLDTAALVHDIEYIGLPQEVADANMHKNLGFPLNIVTKSAFAIKDLVGYPIEIKPNDYNALKEYVKLSPDYSKVLEHYNVKFAEDQAGMIDEENDKDVGFLKDNKSGFTFNSALSDNVKADEVIAQVSSDMGLTQLNAKANWVSPNLRGDI